MCKKKCYVKTKLVLYLIEKKKQQQQTNRQTRFDESNIKRGFLRMSFKN